MSDEFVRCLKSLFPTPSYEVKTEINKLIKKNRLDASCFFASAFQKSLIQGDIITHMPFVTFSSGSKIMEERLYGMMLSTPCDFKNNDKVLFAPCYNLNYFVEAYGEDKSRIDALKNNIIYDKFYIPAYLKCPELVADFNGINSYEVSFIIEQLGNNLSKQVASLTLAGYYYLLAKMTVHFMRPEPREIVAVRTDS